MQKIMVVGSDACLKHKNHQSCKLIFQDSLSHSHLSYLGGYRGRQDEIGLFEGTEDKARKAEWSGQKGGTHYPDEIQTPPHETINRET